MKKRFGWMALSVLMMLSITAQAAGGSGGGNGGGNGGGSGDGTGGGKTETLAVESASVEDGAVLAPEDAITLVFSKNVVNSSVKETNLPLFTVTDDSGAAVEITVTMADDQIEPDKKNDVVIAPADTWADGAYTLTAQAGITSKSGDVMEQDYTLTFSVAAAADSTAVPEDTMDTTAEPTPEDTTEAAEPDTAEDAGAAESETTTPDATGETSTQEQKSNAPMFIGIAVVVVIVAGAAYVLGKKK